MKPSELRAQALFESLNVEDYTGYGYRRLATEFGVSTRVSRLLAQRIRDAGKTQTSEDVVTGYTTLPDGRYLFEWKDGEIRRSCIISEDEMQSMLRAYTKDGDNQSMQIVALRHGLTRRDFEKVKTIYGATKDHEPFTLKEMEDRDLEDLAEEHLTLKRRRLMQTVERRSHQQVKDAARKWYMLQSGLLDPLEGILKDVVGHVPSEESDLEHLPGTENTFITVYQGSDLHLGLYVSGGGYDREEAKRRFSFGLREVIDHAQDAYGDMDYLLLYVGGDVAHVDNVHGATSSMRHHQDMDGTPDTLIQEIVEMYIDCIDWVLSENIPVRLACVPGNHDEIISRAIISALWAAYRNVDGVSFGNLTESHSYEVYGNNALIGHHGHGERTAAALGANLSNWLRNRGDSRPHLYAITGNLHHLATKEEDGCILIQQPSPAPADRYHAQNGYDRSRRATVGLYFDKDRGLLGMRYVGF